ncbi:FAD/NAD(P)-binding protein [uncultured Cedecea sp.]|uniref:FAD/NAD(P)-binding protein n=1 Tax=uncultured Cedecea sp. TaxID=988762 RepID=UPI00262C1A63|nr:FAD/NAD(P)-binding protein [uncultured Cedecea sp.]
MKSYAIIGGGFTGISVLAQLLDQPDSKHISITLFDTPEKLAVGTAFAEDVRTNLLNRPVNTMYFREQGDFGVWLEKTISSKPLALDAFIPRSHFGQFLCYQLRQCQQLAAQRGIRLRIVPQRVVDLLPQDQLFQIVTGEGGNGHYNRCFLCLGTTTCHDPYGLINQAGYYDTVWPVNRIEINNNESVAIIGSRLSAHDAAIALASRCRKIYFISRKGMLPRKVSGYQNIIPQVFTQMEIKRLSATYGKITIAQLFRLLRQEFAANNCSLSQFIQHSDPGITAMSILLALNNNISYAWRQLNEQQKQRFILRWQARWQQLRIPIASPNAQKVEELFACGQLEHLHGNIVIKPQAKGFKISIPGSVSVLVDKVINASGISSSPENYPLVHRLMQQGIAAAHPFGGLKICSDSLCLLNTEGIVVPGIKCIGQLTIGEYYAVGNIDVLHSQARLAVESRWHDTYSKMACVGE